MGHPSANIWLDVETEELTNTDLIIQFGSKTVRVRRVSVNIIIAQSHVKEAELYVAVRGHDIPRAIRLPRSAQVGWGAEIEPITGQEIPYGESVASVVHKILSAKPTRTLQAGLGYYATILFTIQGHEKAYLTTKNLYEFPIGRAYRLATRLVGEGLIFPPTRDIYVELDEWNDIYVYYDYSIVRAFRWVIRWLRRRLRLEKKWHDDHWEYHCPSKIRTATNGAHC